MTADDETKPHPVPTGKRAQRPRLEPRPTHRPPVSAGEHEVFSRPDGVGGPFAPKGADRRPRQPAPSAPDPVLHEAFGRPAGSVDVLQRDPYAAPLHPDPEPEPADPWRDTESVAAIGAPGLRAEPVPERRADPQPLGVREVLFGGRVSWRALAILGVIALVIGLLGGLIGRITGTTTTRLTDSHMSLPVADTANPNRGAAADVAAKVAPSVVTIQVTTRDSGSVGSGSVIDAKGGYILTNNHVVQEAVTAKEAKIEVVFSDGSQTPAKLVGTDPGTDVAVIKVAVNGLTQIRIGDSDDLVAGQEVVAIGSPLGLQRTVTTGVVSAVHRPMQGPADGPNPPAAFDTIQTDASINPGNSGGPLLDLQGRMIGVNTLALAPAGGSIGLNFAIASNVARPIAQALIRGEEVQHAELGVNGREVSNDKATGVRVENVKKGSAAERAGIREGDVITAVGDEKVTDFAALVVAIRAVGVGNTTTVTVARGDRKVPIEVTPTAG